MASMVDNIMTRINPTFWDNKGIIPQMTPYRSESELNYTPFKPNIGSIPAMPVNDMTPAVKQPVSPVDNVLEKVDINKIVAKPQVTEIPQIMVNTSQGLNNTDNRSFWDKTKDFASSPFGGSLLTGLLTGGLVAASGGNGLEALSYGAQAGGTASNIYRRERNKQNEQEQKDRYFNSKLAEQQADREYRQLELANKTANDWAMKNAEFENSLKLLEAKKLADIEKERLTGNGNLTSLSAIEQQLNEFTKSFDNMPDKPEAMTAGFVRNLTGMQTPEEANFNSQRNLLFNKIARDLGGEKGVLSDQDIKRVSEALPTMYDSKEQKKAKMQAVYQLLDIARSKQANSGIAQPQNNNDPLGIR